MSATTITLISLILLWILFAWVFRDLVLDIYRERLFALRDELFDLACEGWIEFNDRAYGMLRSTINGHIQFAHRATFIHAILAPIFMRGKEIEGGVQAYRDEWQESLDRLPTAARKKLKRLRARVHLNFAVHVIFTSTIMMLTMIPIVLTIVVWVAGDQIVRKMRKTVEVEALQGFTSRADAMAFDGAMSLDGRSAA